MPLVGIAYYRQVCTIIPVYCRLDMTESGDELLDMDVSPQATPLLEAASNYYQRPTPTPPTPPPHRKRRAPTPPQRRVIRPPPPPQRRVIRPPTPPQQRRVIRAPTPPPRSTPAQLPPQNIGASNVAPGRPPIPPPRSTSNVHSIFMVRASLDITSLGRLLPS